MSCYLANGCEADLPSAGLADGWGLVFIILYFYNMRGIFGSWFSDFHITMKLSKLSLMLGLLACVLDFEHCLCAWKGTVPTWECRIHVRLAMAFLKFASRQKKELEEHFSAPWSDERS